MSQNKCEWLYDVIIVGGGIAGLCMTAILASRDINVACIDRDDTKKQLLDSFDGRTTAISYGSQKLLSAAGIWESLLPYACPIETIHISDGNSPVLLEFLSQEVNNRAFGWIIENRLIRKTLFAHIQKLKTAQHITPATVQDFEVQDQQATAVLNDGCKLSASLIIGADGRGSFTREWMGIDTRGWRYKQSAIVCTALHEHSHNNVALENFRPEGPFAVLPMTDDEKGNHRSSVVWTEHGKNAASFLNESETVFNAALNARFPESYGEIKLTGQRFSYPLGLIHAHKYITPRMALIAEAAHAMHPIAGQGLNMGLRDVAALSDIIIAAHETEQDFGAADLLEQYQRQRRFDNMAMMGATDGLNKLFSNKMESVKFLRRTGLKAVSKLPFAKQFFMKQAMGAAGLLPDLIKDKDIAA